MCSATEIPNVVCSGRCRRVESVKFVSYSNWVSNMLRHSLYRQTINTWSNGLTLFQRKLGRHSGVKSVWHKNRKIESALKQIRRGIRRHMSRLLAVSVFVSLVIAPSTTWLVISPSTIILTSFTSPIIWNYVFLIEASMFTTTWAALSRAFWVSRFWVLILLGLAF